MMLVPVPGDIDSSADPDFFVLVHVGKKSPQRLDSAGFTNNPAM